MHAVNSTPDEAKMVVMVGVSFGQEFQLIQSKISEDSDIPAIMYDLK